MLFNCVELKGPNGIPIYVERIPGVGLVHMSIMVYVGSADDLVVGYPGLYHWFEHVPFRGTEGFPGGAKDFSEKLGRHAGRQNASTGPLTTQFDVTVPLSLWEEGLRYALELVARPLIRNKDVEAERRIILSEMRERASETDVRLSQRAQELVWGDHPTQHPVIGDEESLAGMDADIVRRAHKKGYSWYRMVVFFSGDVAQEEVSDFVSSYIQRTPLPRLSERRMCISHGPCPFILHGIHTEKSGTPSTKIRLHIPLDLVPLGSRTTLELVMVKLMLGMGDSAPLWQRLREELHLVYGVHCYWYDGPDKWGFIIEADTRPGQSQDVLDAIFQVLQKGTGFSEERLQWVHDHMRGSNALTVPSPIGSVNHGIGALNRFGEVITAKEALGRLLSVTYEEIYNRFLTLERNLPEAAIIVFEGEA